MSAARRTSTKKPAAKKSLPAALGFALILPPSLNIAIAVGAVAAAAWRRAAPGADGSFARVVARLAKGR